MHFASSEYTSIDHPIDRSLFSTCAITLIFLIVSLALFGPFIALLLPALVFATLCRFIMKLFSCFVCHPVINFHNNEYFSPDRYLLAEEIRWINSKSNVVVLMLLEDNMDLDALRSIISSRIIKVRKDDTQLNVDSNPQPTAHTTPTHRSFSNRSDLIYAKFSQKITKSKLGWKWKFDENFDIGNHVFKWKNNVSKSTFSDPDKLSQVISQINSLHLDLNRPPWDVHIISTTESQMKSNSNSENKPDKLLKEKLNSDTNSSKGLLIFRIHPSLSDGVSLVHILCASLSDEQCPVELKDRFYSSGKFLNAIRALFVGPVVFIQKWFLTRQDYNIFHQIGHNPYNFKPMVNNSSEKLSIDSGSNKDISHSKDQCKTFTINDKFKFETAEKISEDERIFHFCSYPLSVISRIKGVTRSTFTEVFLAAIAGALRTYQQQISNISHPFDILCLLPTDLTKERHSSSLGRNSSSVASKTSNMSSITDTLPHVGNNYSLVDFGLPTNTEGMIPRLWEVKQRMEELKNSADSIILSGLSRILWHLFPKIVGQRVMNTYYNKNSLSISSLQGPDCGLCIGGKAVHSIIYWFPILCEVSLSISCFTYADSFTCSISANKLQLPNIRLILDSIVYQMDLLNKLLEHRRIPGENKTQRYLTPSGDETKSNLKIGKFETTDKELRNQNLSPSVSSDHLYSRISSIQNQLQNDKDLTIDEMDALRSEFSSLMGILRRRKSCGIDTNGEAADFDEELEELSNTPSGSRRQSMSGLMILSTRRRSLATSLARPLNTINRSRSNSRAALQVSTRKLSSNYLTQTPVSCSSSKRTSLRFPEDIESGTNQDHLNPKFDHRFTKHDKSRTVADSLLITPIDHSDNSNSSSTFITDSGVFRGNMLSSSTPRQLREDQV